MSDDTKNSRVEWIRGLNFGGSIDWAIDLAYWEEGPKEEGVVDWGVVSANLECQSTDWPSSLDELESVIDGIPPQCRNMAVIRTLYSDLLAAVEGYKNAVNGYDDKVRMPPLLSPAPSSAAASKCQT